MKALSNMWSGLHAFSHRRFATSFERRGPRSRTPRHRMPPQLPQSVTGTDELLRKEDGRQA